jgi:hypothetical protein
MKTVTIQIGNSDDKLTQREWASLIHDAGLEIWSSCVHTHFSGGSASNAKFQNYAWVVDMDERGIEALKPKLTEIRKHFKQDSIAWTEGETKFL